MEPFEISECYRPTELKYALTITAEGFSMDDDDWKVEIIGGRGKVTLEKKDCFDDGAGHWFFTLNSEAVGAGQPILAVTAYVPDEDFADGLRTEVYKKRLPIYIY